MTCSGLIHETRIQITLLPTSAGERERGILTVTFITTS